MTWLLGGVVVIALWLLREYGGRRRHRIATHAYHLGKKSRGRAHARRR